MGGPLRNLVANIRENLQERRGGAQCQPSHFDACQTTSCGNAKVFRRACAGGVPAVDLTKTTSCGGVIVGQPSSIVASSSATLYAGPTTVNSGISSAVPVATPGADLNSAGMVTLSSGAMAKIKPDGTIEAVVPLTPGETKLQYTFSFKENGLGRSGTLSGNTTLADLGGIKIHESSADSTQMNITTKANVDTIVIGLQGGKTITISRAEIKAANKSATTPSVAPTSTPTPGSPSTAAPSVAPTPSASPGTVAPPAPSTGATSGTATATPAPASASAPTEAPEYNPDISGSAKLLGTLLESEIGWNGYNRPVDPNFSHKVDKVLELHPTLQQRVALIKEIGVMQLGDLLHEATAFEGVFDKIGAPLNTAADPNALQKVKTAVELLHGEFEKNDFDKYDYYDKEKIKEGLTLIGSLSPEAEVLAAVYWTKFRKDQSPLELSTYSYEDMKDKLKKAVGSTEGSKPEEKPATKEVAAPKSAFNAKIQGDVTEVKSILQTDLGVIRNWGLNSPFHYDLIDPAALGKLDRILNNYPTAGSRANLIDAIGPEELGELVHKLPDAERDPAMNKFLGKLDNTQISTLTGAVDTLMAEYGKSGWPWPLASAFDKTKISEAFSNILELGEGAETFAKLVWYKKCKDDWKSWDYDVMKKTLKEAAAAQ